MAQTYTRQSSMSDGDTITAALFNNEYNQLVNAFTYSSSSASTTGHRHDGTAGQGGNIHTIGDLDFLNKIVADSTNNRWGFFVEVSSSAVEQIRIQDGAIVPVTDNDIDLGTSSLEFKDAYFDGTVTTDALVADTADINGGSIDGATLGTNSAITQAVIDNINIDGTTIGHTSDTDLITLTSGVVTIAGELDATTLDISGNADIDGTTNLDAVDIDGAVQVDGTITVGVDDTGYDVKFFGATASAYMLWDESVDDLILAGAARVVVPDGQLVLGSTAVSSTAAELNILDGATVVVGEINALDLGSTAVGTAIASKAVILDANKDYTGLRNLTITGELDAATLDISGNVDVDGTLETDALSINGTTVTSTAAELNILDGVTVTAAEINTLDGITAVLGELNALDLGSTAVGTAVASKAVILDSNKDYTGIRNFTITGELDAATLDISGDADIDGTTNLDVVDIDGAVDMASTLAVGGVVTANAGVVVDNITIDGTEIDLSSGDLTLDVAGDINLDVGGGDISLQGSGSEYGKFNLSSNNLNIHSSISDGDIVFKGSDGGSAITALTLDMSAAGAATFNDKIIATELDISGNVDIDGTLETDAFSINGTTVSSTAAELNVLDPALKENSSIWIGSDPSGTTDTAANNVALGVNALLVITTGDQNTAGGFESGKALTTSSQSTLLGAYSGYSLTTGANNTHIGRASGGQSATAETGSNNVTLGHSSGAALTSGSDNVAIGYLALDANTTASNNVAIGREAATANTTGTKLVAVGDSALYANTTGNSNTAVGFYSGLDLTEGSNNTVVGVYSGEELSTGDENTFLGAFAGEEVTTADANTAVGYNAGGGASASASTGAGNTSLGHSTLEAVTSGHSNVALGKNAMLAASTAHNNVAVGYQTLDAATTSFYNVAVGAQALTANDTGHYHTAVGYGTLKALSGDHYYNTAVGYLAGEDLTTGDNNTYIGAFAGEEATTAEYNAVVGYNAGGGATASGSATTGNYNAVLGYSALEKPTTAGSNTTVGAFAMQSNLTANNSVCVGYKAGQAITEGDANTLVGYSAGVTATDLETGAYNTLVGAFCDTTATDSQKAVGIGYNLDCEAGYTTLGEGSNDIRAAHGTATWNTVSDERYKKDIVDSSAGLNFINALRPRTFRYKTLGELPETFRAYEAGSTEVFKNSKTNHGFIAQEVKAAIDADDSIKDGFKLWDNRDDGSQEVAESALIPILVQAIQEQQALIESLTARITTLEG